MKKHLFIICVLIIVAAIFTAIFASTPDAKVEEQTLVLSEQEQPSDSIVLFDDINSLTD